jgi:hypothetical protein
MKDKARRERQESKTPVAKGMLALPSLACASPLAHLTLEGLNQIVNIKASMNLGLSDMLKSEFKEYSPVERPEINSENVLDPS